MLQSHYSLVPNTEKTLLKQHDSFKTRQKAFCYKIINDEDKTVTFSPAAL